MLAHDGDGICLRAVVAIPARNERERIGACLAALKNQIGVAPGSFGILILLNNCDDDTAEVVGEFSMYPWPIRVIELEHETATAGWARAMAMDAAAEWLATDGSDEGVILTSDADSRVGADWVSRNLAAIGAGADAVAGRIALDADDAALLPDALLRRGRREARYERLLTEIGALVDPDPANPWPCHWTSSGATIAIRLPVYRAIGGVPQLPCGEDRALIDLVRGRGFRVRHAPDIEIVTSGRLEGRAAGGVADTIRLRCAVPASPCDERLERIDRFLLRMVRDRWFGKLPPRSPRLPLSPSALPLNIALASIVVVSLRLVTEIARARRRVDRPRLVPDAVPASSLPTPP